MLLFQLDFNSHLIFWNDIQHHNLKKVWAAKPQVLVTKPIIQVCLRLHFEKRTLVLELVPVPHSGDNTKGFGHQTLKTILCI